jgi:hypothetical protein
VLDRPSPSVLHGIYIYPPRVHVGLGKDWSRRRSGPTTLRGHAVAASDRAQQGTHILSQITVAPDRAGSPGVRSDGRARGRATVR